MSGISPPDLRAAPFESGMPRLALQSAVLSRDTLCWCNLLLTLPMGGTSSLDPLTAPFESGMPGLVPPGTFIGVVRCLLSRWAPHRLWTLQPYRSKLGCRDSCSSRRSFSQGRRRTQPSGCGVGTARIYGLFHLFIIHSRPTSLSLTLNFSLVPRTHRRTTPPAPHTHQYRSASDKSQGSRTTGPNRCSRGKNQRLESGL